MGVVLVRWCCSDRERALTARIEPSVSGVAVLRKITTTAGLCAIVSGGKSEISLVKDRDRPAGAKKSENNPSPFNNSNKRARYPFRTHPNTFTNTPAHKFGENPSKVH